MSVHQKCCSEDLQIQCKLQALQVSEKQKGHIRINQSWKKTVDNNLEVLLPPNLSDLHSRL